MGGGERYRVLRWRREIQGVEVEERDTRCGGGGERYRVLR